MQKVKLDLELALPIDAVECQACILRVTAALKATRGILEAHVAEISGATPRRLCVHYDSDAVSLERVRRLVKDAGATIASQIEHFVVPMTSAVRERHRRVAEELLSKEPGVLHASVASGSRRIFVEFEPKRASRKTLLAAMTRAGLPMAPVSTVEALPEEEAHGSDGEHSHGGLFGDRTEFVFSIACGALTGLGWALTKTSIADYVVTTVFVVAYGLGGWFPAKEVWVAVRARKLEIDFLMLLAAVGAAVLGEWFEGSLLLFLFTFGHALEGYALGRTRKAIEALSSLVPQTAICLDPAGTESEVPIGQLKVGDRVLIKPNTRIPSDGFVVAGTSNVNQAPVTGESVPVEKVPVANAEATATVAGLGAENRVFAGTINGSGVLTVAVTKVASDSTLARVMQMVAEAETQQSPTQRFTDRFERIFVPTILGVVVILLFAWVVIDETFAQSFYRAMAVLVAASPCALAIATPSAVLSGVARGARGGVLIKGGGNLEILGLVRAIAFDKTGTLTVGKPRLTDVVSMEGIDEVELLQIAVAVEKQSDHPLAAAIVTGAAERLPTGLVAKVARDAEGIPGFGVRANVSGVPVLMGKSALFTKTGALPQGVSAATDRLQADGRSVMIVKAGERFLGVLGVMDTPRDGAPQVVSRLRDLGIECCIMLTGDHQAVADAVAKYVGVDEARGDLLPEQKVAAIEELAASSRLVAMVGDGVNDAPAMAKASVGIAMGAGSSDVALETADVALLADDLSALPFAVGLSRAVRRTIRQNLWISLGMVAFLVPATVAGFAGIGLAVLLHEGSTLVVVVNALRLLAYSDDRPLAKATND